MEMHHLLYFQDAGVSSNPYVAAILTGIIRQFGTLVGALLLSRFRRKLIMVSSALVMTLSMVALGDQCCDVISI